MASQTPPPCDFTHFCEFTPQHTKTHPTDESHGGVGAQGVESEPSWTLRLRVWQSTKQACWRRCGSDARPGRRAGSTPRESWAIDSRVFSCYTTHQSLSHWESNMRLLSGARPNSLPSTNRRLDGPRVQQVVIHARHSFSRAVRDTSCLQSAHCGEGADCTHHVRMQER